jgi:hypothetical protein
MCGTYLSSPAPRRRLETARDYVRYAAGSARSRSGAGLELRRLRRELGRLERARSRLLFELGAAVYAEDAQAREAIVGSIRAADEGLEGKRAERRRVIERFEHHARRERLVRAADRGIEGTAGRGSRDGAALRSMRRWLRPGILAAIVAAAGCGSSSAPTLPRDAALSLARQSDAVARALDRGDPCAAARLARALRRQADSASSSGRVPRALAPELRRRAARLASSIVCLPPPPPPPPPPPAEHGKKEHGKGHDKVKEKHKAKEKD